MTESFAFFHKVSKVIDNTAVATGWKQVPCKQMLLSKSPGVALPYLLEHQGPQRDHCQGVSSMFQISWGQIYSIKYKQIPLSVLDSLRTNSKL